METRLVISTVSEKYRHVSSLGIRASLFIFITSAPASFFTLLLRLCFCYPPVAACSLCSGGWWSTATAGQEGKHGHPFLFSFFFTDVEWRSWKDTLESSSAPLPNLHEECHFLWLRRRRLVFLCSCLMWINIDNDAFETTHYLIGRREWTGTRLRSLLDETYCVVQG